MKVVLAVAASAVLFALVGAGSAVLSGAGTSPTELAVPPAGEVRAEVLADGAPVFVVAHPDGAVSVLSPINPHLDVLAVWCPRARTFLEPGPASRWDERGRYLGGPAPEGLTPYEAEVVGTGDRRVVVVGERAAAPGREVPPFAPSGPSCDWSQRQTPEGPVEVIQGVVGHDLDERYGAPRRPEDARPGRASRFDRYTARLAVGGGSAVLCSPRPEPGCPAGSPALRSSFHGTPWPDPEHCTGQVDAELLARRTIAGFADAAVYPGFTEVGVAGGGLYEAAFDCDHPAAVRTVASVSGELVAVVRDGDRWVAVLDEPRTPEPFDPPAEGAATLGSRARWVLADDALVDAHELLFRLDPRPGEQLPQTIFRPRQLPRLLDEHGPLRVELWLRGDGTVQSGSLDLLRLHGGR